MAEDTDQSEKTEEPSQHRIEESRKKGEVASSKELSSVLVMTASFMTLIISLSFMFEVISEYVTWLYGLEMQNAFTPTMLKTIMAKTLAAIGKVVAPVFLVTLCAGIVAQILQIGFLFSPEVLTLKPERINPIQGFKRLFSMKSLVEAIKGVFKFVFILSIVYYFIKDDLHSFNGFYHSELQNSFEYGKWIIAKLMFSIIGGLMVIAAFDFAYQKYSYKRKMMMTKEEAKRESKEQDGNPEVKQRIRAIQREMSAKRMMAEVPGADVIITNPTHISIAVKYDSATMTSPTVVAKGADAVAMKIREIAKGHDVPIVENVPLARTLYKTVKIDEAVPRNLYKAVAEVLAFVYKLKRKKKVFA